jgi:hypothetical protein
MFPSSIELCSFSSSGAFVKLYGSRLVNILLCRAIATSRRIAVALKPADSFGIMPESTINTTRDEFANRNVFE